MSSYTVSESPTVYGEAPFVTPLIWDVTLPDGSSYPEARPWAVQDILEGGTPPPPVLRWSSEEEPETIEMSERVSDFRARLEEASLRDSPRTAHGWADAYRLAVVHSHGWASHWADICEESLLDPVATLRALDEASAREILLSTYEIGEREILGCGGLPPSLTHTTASGRVRWECGPARGWIEVYRPVGRGLWGEVCIARMRWWKSSEVILSENEWSEDEDGPGELHQRHVDALAACASALGIHLPTPPRVTPYPAEEEYP